MMRTIMRGALAGAAGTTVLNAATYVDMAIRGRPASGTPERTVEVLAGKARLTVPGSGPRRDARLTGLGALNGIVVGTGVGILAAGLTRAGVRPPRWAGSIAVAALAMAASDVPMARLGVSDPRSWSATDWISDALPHLAYGLAVYAAVSDVPEQS